MKFKRIGAMLLSVAMVGTMLAGCGSKPAEPTVEEKESVVAEVPEKEAVEEVADAAEEENEWLVSDEPITITGMGFISPAQMEISDYNQLPAIQEFSKKTNLYFDWTGMPNGQNQAEQINLSFASKKMPDIYTRIGKADALKYGQQGALIDLWPLVEEYAPHIKAALEADPTILGLNMTEEGQLYMIPQVDADYRLASFKMMVIQQGWLDQLGLKTPETREDLVEVLTAFRDHAEELSDQTVIPYTSYVTGGMEGFFDVFGWTYGMNTSKAYVKDGRIVYGVLQPEFKETVEFVNGLYKEGLIDHDLDANKDDATFEAKMTNNRVGIGYVGQGRFGGYNMVAGPTFENFEFVPLQPLKDDNGNIRYCAIDGLGKSTGLAISINNKYPVETIKAWDYIFSDEGKVLMNFGFEGDTYEFVDGHYNYTDKILHDPDLNSNQTIMTKISPLFDFPAARIYDFERSLYGEKLAAWKEANLEAGVYDNGKVNYDLSQLPLSQDVFKEYSTINADINTYIGESLVKFINGTWTIDANYDEFVATLKKMGLDDLINVMNEGYERLAK